MLAEIEAHLRGRPADREAWLVYADALLEADQRELAAAVQDALGGGRGARIPALPGTDVAWRMGLWRAVSVSDRAQLAAALAHPAARLVEHVILPLGAVDPGLLASVPGLRRVDVTGGGAEAGGLAALGEALDRLEEVRWEGAIRAAPVAPALRRLVADTVPSWGGADLPQLERLELLSAEDGALRELGRADGLPALRWLAVRRRARAAAGALDELLGGALGRTLRRVEVPGVPDAAVRERLDLVVVDVGDEGFAVPGIRARAVAYPAGTDFVRMAPPSSPLEAELAFCAAVADVGGTVEYWEDVEDGGWIGVPAGWGRTIAARMAVVAGAPAQQVVVQTATVSEPSGRVRQVSLSAGAWEIGPDGASAAVRLEETAHEATTEVAGWEEEERHDQHEVVEELLAELLGERVGPSMWLPVGWRPDPFELAGAVVGAVPVRIGAQSVPPEVGRYAVWRLRWVGGLAPAPVPDVARWTERLLRRHGLERPPADDAHLYWADWLGRTREERARRAADRDRVAAFKLTAPGRWLVAADEAEVLARWLRQPIDHHRAPVPLGPLLAALEGGGEIEVGG